MAQDYVSLDEAAEQLGVSIDKLNAMREAGDFRAFRDGPGWKLKSEEIEQIAELLRNGAGSGESESDEDADSILLSELELGESSSGPSSTIIGAELPPGKSDVQLADEVTLEDSDLKLAQEPSTTSDVRLAESSSDILSEAEPDSAATDDTKGSGLGSGFADLDELEINLDDTASSLSLDAGEKLTDESATMMASNESLGIAPGDSTIKLSDDEDDEIVLGAGAGSDITLGAEDSGISLGSPSESGLALDEQPLELSSGSDVDPLLLDDEGEITLDAQSDSESDTMFQSDKDFELEPHLEAGDDESDDSGSQVIPIDSDSFDDSSATMLGTGDALAPLEAELLDEDMAGHATAAHPLGPIPDLVPEASYSVWNVMSLMVCCMLLAVIGMMMFDLVRNMWSWNETVALNSSLMDAVIETFPFFK